MNKTKLEVVAEQLRRLRRQYSKRLVALSEEDKYYYEDIARLVGTLEAAYNHARASLAGDGDIYCLLGKHLPYALILLGEIGEPVDDVYDILTTLSDGKIVACQSCKEDASVPN